MERAPCGSAEPVGGQVVEFQPGHHVAFSLRAFDGHPRHHCAGPGRRTAEVEAELKGKLTNDYVDCWVMQDGDTRKAWLRDEVRDGLDEAGIAAEFMAAPDH